MFLDIDKKEKEKIAIIDDSGHILTYGDIACVISDLRKLNIPRCVVFNMCENSAGALIGYLAFESGGQVPLMLSSHIDDKLLNAYDELYSPRYYWMPKSMNVSKEVIFEVYGYVLVCTEYTIYPLNDKLSMLLSTSGTTGSPKLVRHKYGNLEANALNVASVFGWTVDDRGICNLPMNYTMGLNVINSHLVVGATVILTKANLMDPLFWEFVEINGGTNFCGVPFSYEVIRRIGLNKMNFPSLKTLAQGGGKLSDKMFEMLARYALDCNKRFCATFGTTETSARMSYLDPSIALTKIGSIGKAIPGGELFLKDEIYRNDGMYEGELGYKGPNVTMGYAICKEDLLKDDEFKGVYLTGDIAVRDKDGFYYIIGRKKRFLKLFGMRVGLDEIECLLKNEFNDQFVCIGNDKKMTIFTTNISISDKVIPFISKTTNLHSSAFTVRVVDDIPRNESGKIKFCELEELK